MAFMNQPLSAWIFPGQGSQKVGMGKDLASAFPSVAQVYEQADTILGIPLSHLCFEGPEEQLTQTIHAQPALLTTSIAVLLALGGVLDADGRLQLPQRLPPPHFLAGHSLGEYTALVAAGTLSFPDALRLVRERGRLMGEAQSGSMAAVIGMEEEVLEDICREYRQKGPLVIANYNSPGQLVLSGASQALEPAMAAAKEWGARRVIPLKVSAAFHSPLMDEAANGLAQAIAKISFAPAQIPIVANVTAKPIQNPEELASELVSQVCNPVRWTDSFRYMAGQCVGQFLEVGPGKVLGGLAHRILPEAEVSNLGTLEQVQAMLEQSGPAN
jgi:[acyl-carrier-protein] S-malonyltransferase